MLPSNDLSQRSSLSYRPAIRHRGPCGVRRPCWRQACRERFGPYPSVESLPTGELVTFCHAATYPPGDVLARIAA